MERERLTIERMGHEGDGLATVGGRVRPVPFTLPGEVVETDPLAVIEASPDRVEPECRHFGTCGNCALQHWAAGPMLDWKREQVRAAFAHAGLKVDVAPIVPVPPHSRRRVVFARAQAPDGSIALGYHRRRSETVFPVTQCPILVPEIERSLDGLARLASVMLFSMEQVAVTACETGLDVQIVASAAATADEKRGIFRVADEHLPQAVRVSVGDEVIFAREAALVRFGTVAVTPPPGAFLQATQTSEAAMADLVTGHLKGARRPLDLFAGCGTFALRLGGRVHAIDETGPALAALADAAAAAGLDSATVEKRDLFERPLDAAELDRYDALVLDPPRAGAEAQIAHVSESGLTRIAYVSCNPQTLARDVAVLVQAGWTVKSVTPIDQFLYSPHVEAVCLLERKKVRRKRPLFG